MAALICRCVGKTLPKHPEKLTSSLFNVAYIAYRPTRCHYYQKVLRRFNSSISSSRKGKLVRPLIFTCLFGAGTFTCCAILQYERIRHSIITGGVYSEGFGTSYKELSFRAAINRWWNRLDDGQKLVTGIIAVNAFVFTCWQIPALRHFMTKWFTASAFNGRISPMFLSTFSHAELWHLGCNMLVLWSFASPIQDLLGVEQFLAFYLTGGVVAAFCSHAVKLVSMNPVASLGASGALLAVLGAVCIERPDARLGILFIPFLSFSAQTALMSIIALDIAGLLLRWRIFDHGAHLGGTLFGIWYVKYGHQLIWDNRNPLYQWWHKLREKSQK